MTNIQFLKDRIIIDGHAETKQECETITLLCDNLAKSKDFKTVRYENGYAEFEKVGKASELKFAAEPAVIKMVWDSHVTSVSWVNTSSGNGETESASWTTSGEEQTLWGRNTTTGVVTVVLEEGYVLNTVTWEGDGAPIGTISGKNTFELGNFVNNVNGTATITTKQSGSSDNLTWVINETPTLGTTEFTQDFISNNINYNAIRIRPNTLSYYNGSEGIYVPQYEKDSGWYSEANRTITFLNPVTDSALLAWLQANATQPTHSTKQQIDLSKLSGWANLASGNHNITVKAKASGYADSAASNAVNVSIIVLWKASVSNLGAQDPNTVVFNTPADSVPKPWSEVEFNGDVFIKFPKMYKKIVTVTDNQITAFEISNAKLDDDYKLYPCFIDESGNELDYILVGKYMSKSSTTCNSVASGSVIGQTISKGRTRARERGNGYQLMDWRIQRLWQDLLICIMKTVNTNSGSGITTDALGLLWGSPYSWIDGFCHIDSSWVYSNSPSKYIDSPTALSDGYESISGYTAPTTGGVEIKKLGYDSTQPFFNYPSEVVSNSSYNTYYCDGYGYSSGNHPVFNRVGESGSGSGAIACYGNFSWSDSNGVRLCYRPIS